MNSPEKKDSIDTLLCEQDAHVADNGFTGRVIARLPRRQSLLPRALLLTVAIVGTALTVYWFPFRSLPPLDYQAIGSFDSKTLTAWLPFAAIVAALVSAARAGLQTED
jgi:hypothetical protein